MTTNLVTFFSAPNKDGTRLVGIGITDEIIEHLKKSGAILEDSKRTKMGTDIVLLYAPTTNEVTKKITDLLGKDKTRVNII